MLFNSIEFVLFFAVVVTGYFSLPARVKWVFLLAASYYFYMRWNAVYAVLIVSSTAVNYFAGLYMGRVSTERQRTGLLIASLVTSLGLLFTFKYFNFFAASVHALLQAMSIETNPVALKVALPVGISFYTFQTLSYTIDVYRRHIKPEPNFGRFALYVSFFPQLVAGPIERASNLIPQLRENTTFDWVRVCDGLKLMAWGVFKKVVIADRLALYVSSIYNNVEHHSGPSYLIATYFFAFQIYCDFSGYSDVAIGAAKVLGFDLMENFRRPYFATTITEFWRRWHISLSTWLRDYLYIPLGGNRKGGSRTYVNLLITMLLGGLWHGAAWTFVIWGAMQGVMLAASKLTLPTRDRLVQQLGIPTPIVTAMRMAITFHLVCLSWVFFRANTLSDAVHILTHLTTGWPMPFIEPLSMAYGVMGICFLVMVQYWQSKGSVREYLRAMPVPVRWTAYSMVVFGIVLFGVDEGTQFIYFQF